MKVDWIPPSERTSHIPGLTYKERDAAGATNRRSEELRALQDEIRHDNHSVPWRFGRYCAHLGCESVRHEALLCADAAKMPRKSADSYHRHLENITRKKRRNLRLLYEWWL